MKRYTTAQAAAELGISEGLVRRYCRAGRLGSRIGRNFSITKTQLKRFAEKERKAGRPAQQLAASARKSSRPQGNE